jgi:hypothetical protein
MGRRSKAYNMKRKYFILIALVIIIVCVKFYMDYQENIKVHTNEELIGLTKTVILEKYGNPNTSIEFILSSRVHEYQYNLINIYPEPDGKNIKILELTWVDDKFKFAVWFHKMDGEWRVIDNIKWNFHNIKF